MKFERALILALLCLTGASASTPVQKVIELLNGMLQKGKAEKHDEQVQFATFKQFCEDTVSQKSQAVKEADQTIEGLKADISDYAETAKVLGKEIAAHEADVAAWKGDKKAATKVREFEKADYDAMHTDYSESVDALNRAIEVLKKQARNRKQASLTQVAALKDVSLIPEKAKRTIDVFLAQSEDPDEGLAVSAPEAHGYESQSHGVIDMLEKLLDKFITERTNLEKGEMDSRHAFEMLIQDLTSEIDEANQDITEKSSVKAKKLQARADAEGDLADTTTTRDADQKYVTELAATCETKATDFESRQTLRAEELEAIQKAIEIISGDAVQGNAEKHLPTLIQARGSALAQFYSDANNKDQTHAAEYLRDRAKVLNSRVLAAAAARVGSDPFKKVKKMIKDLIVRLMEEATEEAEHKGWCDTELSTNEQTRKQKTVAVETLHAEIDSLQASVAKLSEDISDLSLAITELDAAMTKATELRREEKAKNTETIADAQAAETAVVQALTVLNEFYSKAGEATALVQQQPEAPEIFDKPYQGMQAENGGVIGMLEVIQADFARLKSDTESEEAVSAKEYQEFMSDSKVDKSAKSKDLEHKTAKKQDNEQALTTKKADLEGTQKELTAAMAYYDKLKPSCVDAGVSYDDRTTRRKEEIESLQEALRILNGEDIA